MKEQPKFDPEISVRTAAIAALVGWLTGPKIGMPPEAAAGIGAVAGWLIDRLLFRMKQGKQPKE